jgi:Type II secretion system (T2SS), protein F
MQPHRQTGHDLDPLPLIAGQTNRSGDSAVKIDEETGELDKMLSKIADFYEDEVDTAIQSLTSIIEPIVMIGSAQWSARS